MKLTESPQLSVNEWINQYRVSGIQRHGVLLFTPNIALDIIDEAEKSNTPIIGADAFILRLKTIQPFMEHSLDFSKAKDGAWDAARTLIASKRNTEFLFELTFTEPNEEIHKRSMKYL